MLTYDSEAGLWELLNIWDSEPSTTLSQLLGLWSLFLIVFTFKYFQLSIFFAVLLLLMSFSITNLIFQKSYLRMLGPPLLSTHKKSEFPVGLWGTWKLTFTKPQLASTDSVIPVIKPSFMSSNNFPCFQPDPKSSLASFFFCLIYPLLK